MTPFDIADPERPTDRTENTTTITVSRPATLLAVLQSAAITGTLDPDILKDVTSDFRTLAKLSDLSKGKRHRWTKEMIEQQLATLPADPLLLRPILETILPARLRIKPKRWSNIRSSVGRCLKLTDWIDGDDVVKAPLTADWISFCDTFRGGTTKAEMIGAGAFISVVTAWGCYCSYNGIDWRCVTDDAVESYRTWRRKRTLHLRIDSSIAKLRRGWNEKARRADPAYPMRLLAAPPDPRHYVEEDRLDPAYLAEVDFYVRRLRTPDPLDPIFNKKRAAATILQRQRVLLRIPFNLLKAGRPPESIIGLADVCQADTVKTILLDLYFGLGKGQAWPGPRARFTPSAACKRWRAMSSRRIRRRCRPTTSRRSTASVSWSGWMPLG